MTTADSDAGYVGINNSKSKLIGRFTGSTADGGFFSLFNQGEKEFARFTTLTDGSGYLNLNDQNGTQMVRITTVSGFGNVNTYNGSGTDLARLSQLNGGGCVGVSNPNGRTVGQLCTDGTNGYVVLRNGGGTNTIFLDGRDGSITGYSKNFRIPHPEKPDKDIVYASMEGPETGAYLRGSATLENGRVVIKLPDHFSHVALSEGMTVQLTPLSADSKGLAVVSKSVEEVVVQELFNGDGNYAVDYFIQAVRQGFQNFEVIRDKLELNNCAGCDNKQENRLAPTLSAPVNYSND
jgi:hypothetical protein